MFGITFFGSQIRMTPCKHTLKNLCDVLVQKLPTLLTWWLFKDCPVCMDCLHMHCLSNFHTNNYHMAPDKMNEKAKRTNNLSPKNVTYNINWIIGCTGSYIAFLKRTSILSSHHLHFQKMVQNFIHCNFWNLLPLKRSWVQLFLLHWQHTPLQTNMLKHCG